MKLTNTVLKSLARFTAAWALGLAASPAVMAQPEAADPPGRVGRLAEMTGPVWIFTPESGEWVAAKRNLPVTAGNRLSTEAGSRAEVRVGSTTLRLDSGSELEFVRLDDERVSLDLHNGSVAARVRNREAAAEFDVKTAEGQFTLQRAGRYRFDRTDGTSHVTVDNGQALYEGPRSALTVNSGQHAEFWIDAANTAQYSITEPRQDAFSAWNNDRDRSDDRSVSARYVSPEMTGVEDLDRHGRWEQSPEYGPLWIPRGVASGWAPYSTGHWAWVRPWGWTWVDDAPWGFAPFHYGRWVWHRSAWCWAPGTYVARPVYAPALVAWVGGPSLSVSVSIGGGYAGPAVGWFPLGPREVYVPGYRHSPRYVREVNVTHVTNVNIINAPIGQRDFSNRKFPHAVTVVPTSVMTSRQSVGPAASQMRDAPAVREFVREPQRHAALQEAPVAAPVAVARVADPRARPAPPGANMGAGMGPSDRGREADPGQRNGRPDRRDGDSSRAPAPVLANPMPVNPGNSNGPPMGANRPAPSLPAPAAPPAAVVTAPVAPATQPGLASQQRGDRSERGDRGDRGDRPERGRVEPAPRAVQPVPLPTPMPPTLQMPAAPARNVQSPAPVQGGRAAGYPPAPTVAGPLSAPIAAPMAAPVVRAAPVERAMPDRRHHAQPPTVAVPQTGPVAAPERARARAEAQVPDDRGERRTQRDRSQMVN